MSKGRSDSHFTSVLRRTDGTVVVMSNGPIQSACILINTASRPLRIRAASVRIDGSEASL